MWGTAEGGSGTLFDTVLLLDEMRTSWMYYGRVQAVCNAPLSVSKKECHCEEGAARRGNPPDFQTFSSENLGIFSFSDR